MESSDADGIRWCATDGIGRITLDRPERANTLGLAQSRAFACAVDEVLGAKPRAVLLTGTGSIFCAGGDIQEMAGADDRIDTMIAQMLDPLLLAIERLSSAPVPVVSALNGAVGGAGVGLALCADVVIATASMKLRTGYAAIGLSPDAGASYFLARRVGAERAKRLFFLSEPVDSQLSLALGIVDAVHDDVRFNAETEALVARLAAAATGSLARIKKLCDGVAARGLREHMNLERALLLQASREPAAVEGLRAFLEKRVPRFSEH
ncbi:MAG: enoyl-CoA hydratase/isomerase family protein [Burkholderiaceae bacterium]|nr:enoyl-CoA hydratase/isomerase family protein [Burkholderiaceae bacterium]